MVALSTPVVSTETITLAARRAARKLAGAHASCPVYVVEGNAAPAIAGQSYHWETRGGRRVYHPSAYARTGWSNLVYVSSTLCVEVGAEWLAANLAQ